MPKSKYKNARKPKKSNSPVRNHPMATKPMAHKVNNKPAKTRKGEK